MDIANMMAFIGLLMALCGAVGAGVWRITRSENAIRIELDGEIRSLRVELQNEREKGAREIMEMTHRFGETVVAIRAKVTEVELHARDTYVRREDFINLVGTIRDDIRVMSDKMEARLLRMETKIDEK